MQDAAEKPVGSAVNITAMFFFNRVKFITKHFVHTVFFFKNYITVICSYPFVQSWSVVLLKCKFLITCNVILTVIVAVYFPVICFSAVIVIE
jgi:hypothetical protein